MFVHVALYIMGRWPYYQINMLLLLLLLIVKENSKINKKQHYELFRVKQIQLNKHAF
jgi:hypothetical protein